MPEELGNSLEVAGSDGSIAVAWIFGFGCCDIRTSFFVEALETLVFLLMLTQPFYCPYSEREHLFD